MKLSIHGESAHLSRRETEYAIPWMATHIMGSAAQDLVLTLRFLNERLPGGAAALMGPETAEYCTPFYWIEVDARRYKRQGTLTSIAHELWHVKQCFTGELYLFCPEGKRFMWHGRAVLRKSVRRHDDLPWEMEAYTQEKRTFRAYQEHTRKSFTEA
jgi:hypothetical protein